MHAAYLVILSCLAIAVLTVIIDVVISKVLIPRLKTRIAAIEAALKLEGELSGSPEPGSS
ncbi:MAG: hypothetical protein LBQ12_09140 [Deltaproteobacteria bacterium]|jgi:hypothetical protein|nr:hypothetical protein [Deltaproteobacteria bacterium]